MKNAIFPGASLRILTIPAMKMKNINTLEMRMIAPGIVS
jgi:hypothetical protein